MKKKISKFFFIFILFGVFCILQCVLAKKYLDDRNKPITETYSWDAGGYYLYLPYLFIAHDIRHISYSYPLVNGNRLDKYACGVAILQTPFFLASHFIALNFNLKADGYSDIYAYGIIVASSFYLLCGLIVLFFILKKLFDKRVALISVLLLYTSTNVFFYIVANAGMSHVYSFFCFACFLWFLEKFLKQPSYVNTSLTAFFYALAIEIRPTNCIIGVFFLLYNVYSWAGFKERLGFFLKNLRFVATILIVGLITVLPQLLYWHAVTGDWIVYSYGVNKETFIYWKNPQIYEVIFGIHCGWLPYTPVMIFFFVGLFFLIRDKTYHAFAILFTFIFIVYICASWWAYSFSCAFGYRSFVEYYVVFIIPVAHVIQRILQKGIALKIAASLLLILFAYINIKSSFVHQGWSWCEDSWTWKLYFHSLGKEVF